jgi:enamine deaminase RidA (YjgF/YER057c/UK114 family)
VTVELRNAAGLAEPVGFSHASIAEAGRVVHLAGQGGADSDGVVAGGLAEQTERAILNLREAMEAAGVRPEDLVKLTIYVVGWTEAQAGHLFAGIAKAAEKQGPLPLVPATLVGVQSLFLDSMLVEIEGVLVAPN